VLTNLKNYVANDALLTASKGWAALETLIAGQKESLIGRVVTILTIRQPARSASSSPRCSSANLRSRRAGTSGASSN
jgi:hypothetical protein